MNDLVEEVVADKAELELIAETYNESTGLSWLWAFIFGPIYFWVNGFVARGFVIFALNFVIIGFFLAPFIVYPAWRKRSMEKARKLQVVSKAAQNRSRPSS
jgi:membrane protein insertase Oxa1/YidC/SpoIIIJ